MLRPACDRQVTELLQSFEKSKAVEKAAEERQRRLGSSAASTHDDELFELMRDVDGWEFVSGHAIALEFVESDQVRRVSRL